MSGPIELCFIINNLGQGGAERQLVELIRHIDKRRFKVTVYLYAVNKGVFFREVFDIPGIRVVQHVLKSRFAALKIIEALLYLRRTLKSNRYDVVQTTLFMNGLFVRLVAPGRYSGRIVSTIRTSLDRYTMFHLFAERMLIRGSYVVANSKKAADAFQERIPAGRGGRVRYIYNGYDTGVFRPRERKGADGSVSLGCVGRLHRIKNHLQVARVVHDLNDALIRLTVIGGSGDQEEVLRSFIRQRGLEQSITVMPEQRNIADHYGRFDIFVLPSLLEGCPNVLFEAMLCGCFCIISVNANTDGFVIHGQNGLVYNGTDDDLKMQLQYAISIMGTGLFDGIRENGIRYARENFSVESMVMSYELLYREIARRDQPGRTGGAPAAVHRPVRSATERPNEHDVFERMCL